MALPPRAGMSDTIQIYQDSFFSPPSPMISHAPMPSTANPPQQRRPMQSKPAGNNSNNSSYNGMAQGSNTGHIAISPLIPAPMQSGTNQSPTKMTHSRTTSSPRSPLRAAQNNMLNAVSFVPPATGSKPTDSLQKKQPMMSRFKTVAQKPPVDISRAPTPAYMGKENNHPVIFPAPPGLNLSIENYYQKAPGKRLLEPAPIKDGRPMKRQRLDDGPLPPYDSFPPIIDDGMKPGHSYAMLIGMAILRSKGRKLTLAQIYKWISDTFSFYSPQDAGWQNSIRHNLSLNKAFVKQERPKDDPGKGNYWAIEPGMEYLFMKDKSIRKAPGAGDSLQVMNTTILEPALPPIPTSFHEPALPPQLPRMPYSMTEPSSAAPAPTKQSNRQPELSSDATIVVSDNGAPEEHQENQEHHDQQEHQLHQQIHQQHLVAGEGNNALPELPADVSTFDPSQFSPIPATALHSSPPIVRHTDATTGTPPPVPRALLASSIHRSRKRKSASMDDSGYISSLESSALRSNQNSRHVPLESGDRSRIKRGRAEEEIARLRASSYDSPTKGRSRNGYNPGSSSPLRHNSHGDAASGQMAPPPLTPAVKLKPPMRPPPSVSPGTNLRMHRDKVRHMLASPLRRIASASDDLHGWDSPNAFDESLYNFTEESEFTLGTSTLSHGFEIFQDDSLPNIFPSVHAGSPVKQPPSSKRMRLDRSQSANALSEVTNSASRRNVTSAPFAKAPAPSPGLSIDTPSKFFDNLPSSPSKFFTFQSPSKMPATGIPADLGDENAWPQLDDFGTPDLFQDDGFAGLDILQGFEKIGASVQHQPFTVPPQPRLMPYQQQQQQQQPSSRNGKGAQKPVLGRSYTSTF